MILPAFQSAKDAWFEIRNTANTAVNVGGMGVCARLNGANYDFGFSHQNTIAPNGTLVFSYNKRIDASGTLNLFICSYNESIGGWASSFYPYNTSGLNRSLAFSVADNPAVTAGLSVNPQSPAAGQQSTATFTIRNNGTAAINIGSLTVAGRSPTGANVDFPIVNDVVVPAGGEYTYNQSRTFSQSGGNYRFFIANWNGVWSTTYPSSGAGDTIRSVALTVRDNPLVTAGLVLSQSSPLVGQPTTVTFTIRNDSAVPINVGSMVVAGRGPGGTNVDFPIINDVIIPAGGQYVYSQSRTFTQTGTHTFFIANWNGVWSTTVPKSSDSNIIRNLSVQVR